MRQTTRSVVLLASVINIDDGLVSSNNVILLYRVSCT